MGKTWIKNREMVHKLIKERHVPFLTTEHRTLGTRQMPFNGRDETFSVDIKQSQIKDIHRPISKDPLRGNGRKGVSDFPTHILF